MTRPPAVSVTPVPDVAFELVGREVESRRPRPTLTLPSEVDALGRVGGTGGLAAVRRAGRIRVGRAASAPAGRRRRPAPPAVRRVAGVRCPVLRSARRAAHSAAAEARDARRLQRDRRRRRDAARGRRGDRVVRDRQREADADRRGRAARRRPRRPSRTRWRSASRSAAERSGQGQAVPCVPTRAVVVTFERVTATAGAMSTLPPAAPIFASVIAASPAVALSVTFAAPVRRRRCRASALVVSVIRFRATDAPTPTSSRSRRRPSAPPSPCWPRCSRR